MIKSADVHARVLAMLPSEPSCHSCTTPNCCTQTVQVTPEEARDIAVNCQDQIAAVRDVLEARALMENVHFKDTDYVPGKRARNGARKVAGHKWSGKNLQCPFLVDNKCSIYEHRPVMCASYFAVCSPSECPSRKDGDAFVVSDATYAQLTNNATPTLGLARMVLREEKKWKQTRKP